MDSSPFQHGFQYNVITFGDMELSMANAAQLPVVSAAPILPSMSLPITMTQTMPAANSVVNTVNSGMSTANPNMPAGSSGMHTAISVIPTANLDIAPANAGITAAISGISGASAGVPTANSSMPPPLRTFWAPASMGSETESSFNDSGYFSSPQEAQFTALHSRLPPSSGSQLGVSCNQAPPPSSSVPVSSPMATPRSSWHEDFPNISDEWDSSFINNFEENLFGIDASDLNNMVDGILGSPFKSPTSSPFQSPNQMRGAAHGLAVSPMSQFASSMMLTGLRKSPARLDSSPFKNLFSTPSPIKSQNPYTRTSPLTRQRRRILQSPARKPEELSDHFLGLPSILSTNKEIEQNDDLGVTPFQRTNSLGFTPTEGICASPAFPIEETSMQNRQPFMCENTMPSSQLDKASPRLQEAGHVTHPKQHKKNKTESLYNLRSSPAKKEMLNEQQNFFSQRSPAHLTQGRISVTRHSHLVDKLDSKGALRFVRARFKEVLAKTVADVDKRNADKLVHSKQKARSRKQQQHPEISQALAQPVSSSLAESSASVPCYTQIQPHRPGAKRRQEILPKPTPDWPQRQPCKIAPKKRKR